MDPVWHSRLHYFFQVNGLRLNQFLRALLEVAEDRCALSLTAANVECFTTAKALAASLVEFPGELFRVEIAREKIRIARNKPNSGDGVCEKKFHFDQAPFSATSYIGEKVRSCFWQYLLDFQKDTDWLEKAYGAVV